MHSLYFQISCSTWWYTFGFEKMVISNIITMYHFLFTQKFDAKILYKHIWIFATWCCIYHLGNRNYFPSSEQSATRFWDVYKICTFRLWRLWCTNIIMMLWFSLVTFIFWKYTFTFKMLQIKYYEIIAFKWNIKMATYKYLM